MGHTRTRRRAATARRVVAAVTPISKSNSDVGSLTVIVDLSTKAGLW